MIAGCAVLMLYLSAPGAAALARGYAAAVEKLNESHARTPEGGQALLATDAGRRHP